MELDGLLRVLDDVSVGQLVTRVAVHAGIGLRVLLRVQILPNGAVPDPAVAEDGRGGRGRLSKAHLGLHASR